MYSCAAISAFEAPWPARRAICASRAVRASRVCAVRLGALARRAQFYPCPFGKRPGTGRGEDLVSGAKLIAGFTSAALAAQPLTLAA